MISEVAFWRDIAVILLVVEAFAIGLPILILGVQAVRLLQQGHRWLQDNFPVWQVGLSAVRDAVETYSALAIAPVVAIGSAVAAIAAILRLITPPQRT